MVSNIVRRVYRRHKMDLKELAATTANNNLLKPPEVWPLLEPWPVVQLKGLTVRTLGVYLRGTQLAPSPGNRAPRDGHFHGRHSLGQMGVVGFQWFTAVQHGTLCRRSFQFPHSRLIAKSTSTRSLPPSFLPLATVNK